MTTKHVKDRTAHDADPTPVGTTGGATEQAEDASRQLLAKARYDAFRLMTEARDEAEAILAESRAEAAGMKTAAEIIATSTTDKAKVDAAAIVESAHEEAASIVAGAHRRAGEEAPDTSSHALEVEHKTLSERVSTLRTVADQLEERFAALASTAASPPPEEPSAAAKPEYSPSVAPKPKSEPEAEPATTNEDRRSYYDRRSAKLPRLGDDAGRGALDMTRVMRKSLETD